MEIPRQIQSVHLNDFVIQAKPGVKLKIRTIVNISTVPTALSCRMTHEDARCFVNRTVACLVARRKALGLSKRSLASKACLDPSTIGLIERGERSPTLHTVALIAAALDLELTEIISTAAAPDR
ncbi:MAG TPA: helix-turn-helix transcriptional regulator [Bacteroidia bacterium]|nr:helix-turn-helix transcriptional regulator [Bacteroidia bacterium]